MGYAICTGSCLTCGKVFQFNPVKVPSLRVKGVREPVCQSCMDLVNAKRAETGLPPHEIDSEAYTACEESELV